MRRERVVYNPLYSFQASSGGNNDVVKAAFENSVFNTSEAVSPVKPTNIIGIIGRVQGDKNVNIPARNDTPKPKSYPKSSSRLKPKEGSFMLAMSHTPISASNKPDTLFTMLNLAPERFSQFHMGVRNRAKAKKPKFIPIKKPVKKTYAFTLG